MSRSVRKLRFATIVLGCLVGATTGCASISVPRLPAIPTADVSPVREERQRELIATFERKRDLAEYAAAMSRLGEGKTREAEAQFEELLERNPDHTLARLRLVELHMADGRLEDAFELLRPLVLNHGDDAEVQHAMGLLLESSGQSHGALVYYERALELDQDNTIYEIDYEIALSNAQGNARISDTQMNNSATDSNQVVSALGMPAQLSHAGTDHDGENTPCAVPNCACVRVTPSDLQPPRTAEETALCGANSSACSSRAQPAKESLTTATRRHPLRPKQASGSADRYETVFEVDPDVPAEKFSDPATAAESRVAAAQVAQIEHLLASGAPQAAASLCREVYAAKPNDPNIRVTCAAMLIKHNEPERALPLLRAAVVKFPTHAGLCRLLAVALYRVGSYDDAVARFERAVSLDKSDALSYFLLGIALDKVGRPTEARRNYGVASRLDPSLVSPR